MITKFQSRDDFVVRSHAPLAAAASSSAAVFPDLDGPRLFGPGNIPTADVLVRLESMFRTVLHVTIPTRVQGPQRPLRPEADAARKRTSSPRVSSRTCAGESCRARVTTGITAGPGSSYIFHESIRALSGVRKKGTTLHESYNLHLRTSTGRACI